MKILIVDDHPIIISGYVEILKKLDNVFNFEYAYSAEQAYGIIINNINKKTNIDIAIVDERIPIFEGQKLYSGSDVATYINKNIPHCKVLMITGHSEMLSVYDIIKKVRPLGLIIKSDLNTSILCTAVKKILDGEKFYSATVNKCISEIWNDDLLNDDHNRKIIKLLSRGYRLQELETKLHLSTSAIQKRIAKLKNYFEVDDISDLLKSVIRKGYL